MQSRFADNVVHFTRVLRAAGLPVGTERSLAALRALELVGLDDRNRVHDALAAVLIDRHEHQALFDSAFAAFWRDPKLLERVMALALPQVSGRMDPPDTKRPRRLEEALAARSDPPPASADDDEPPDQPIDFDAVLTVSERERLQSADFDSMTVDEYRQALELADLLPCLLEPVPVRRQRAATRGTIDLRAMLRASAREPLGAAPRYRRTQREAPPLVILIDISGSMQRYSRLFLHWAHALSRRSAHVETLTLGTRLTRITHALRHRDVDAALHDAGVQVADWAGGTRLGSCLHEFNRHWARRLLAGNASLLLLTDGLERDDSGELSREARTLRAFARRVIWLNPLLRFDGFEPRAAGIRALLPHVDAFLPAHNLNSLRDVAATLRDPQAFARTRDYQLRAARFTRLPVTTTQ